ncbi:hypothetical protein [Methanosarcina barkeri]|uniref:hypothetical protein n=1 Tax=Methanosarcina barkeri TaxID=2208 RepID=UPI00064F5627|nr:hypothetical protein [Methanosarcina barkeri]
MYEIDRKKSMLLFGLLVLAVAGLSLIAYHISGHMGIEERFNSAVGIESGPEEEESSGIFGFNIEGNPLYYAVILVVLIILCLIIYIKK